MFCHKCGNQLPGGSGFCQKCGAKLTAPETNQECGIRFLPRKIFGQWMLRKAAIDIGGGTYMTKIKRPVDFSIRAGSYNVLTYGMYLGQSCKARLIHTFEPGRQYLIRYKSSLFIFQRGKIKIEEYPVGTVLPKK